MTSFLLTWKEEKWPHDELMELVRHCARYGFADDSWRVISHKRVELGDRVWLLRQGSGAKVIFAVGNVTGDVFLGDDKAYYVPVRFTEFVDPKAQALIGEDAVADILKEQVRVQASGYPIGVERAQSLELALEIGKIAIESPVQPADSGRNEGTATERLSRDRSRDPQLRKQKLDASRSLNGGRLICEVPNCGFDFVERYGELGRGFAHVHHKDPLAERPNEGSETHLEDLAVVCPNCHSMIHRGGKCRDMDRLIRAE